MGGRLSSTTPVPGPDPAVPPAKAVNPFVAADSAPRQPPVAAAPPAAAAGEKPKSYPTRAGFFVRDTRPPPPAVVEARLEPSDVAAMNRAIARMEHHPSVAAGADAAGDVAAGELNPQPAASAGTGAGTGTAMRNAERADARSAYWKRVKPKESAIYLGAEIEHARYHKRMQYYRSLLTPREWIPSITGAVAGVVTGLLIPARYGRSFRLAPMQLFPVTAFGYDFYRHITVAPELISVDQAAVLRDSLAKWARTYPDAMTLPHIYAPLPMHIRPPLKPWSGDPRERWADRDSAIGVSLLTSRAGHDSSSKSAESQLIAFREEWIQRLEQRLTAGGGGGGGGGEPKSKYLSDLQFRQSAISEWMSSHPAFVHPASIASVVSKPVVWAHNAVSSAVSAPDEPMGRGGIDPSLDLTLWIGARDIPAAETMAERMNPNSVQIKIPKVGTGMEWVPPLAARLSRRIVWPNYLTTPPITSAASTSAATAATATTAAGEGWVNRTAPAPAPDPKTGISVYELTPRSLLPIIDSLNTLSVDDRMYTFVGLQSGLFERISTDAARRHLIPSRVASALTAPPTAAAAAAASASA